MFLFLLQSSTEANPLIMTFSPTFQRREAERTIAGLKAHNEDLIGRCRGLEELLRCEQGIAGTLSNENQALNGQYAEAQIEITSLRTLLDATTGSFEELEKELRNAETRANKFQGKNAGMQAKIDELTQSLAELEGSLNTEKENHQYGIRVLTEQLESEKFQRKMLHQENAKNQTAIAELKRLLSATNDQLASMKKAFEESEKKKTTANQERERLRKDLEELQAKLADPSQQKSKGKSAPPVPSKKSKSDDVDELQALNDVLSIEAKKLKDQLDQIQKENLAIKKERERLRADAQRYSQLLDNCRDAMTLRIDDLLRGFKFSEAREVY